jgi:hypothetical protein
VQTMRSGIVMPDAFRDASKSSVTQPTTKQV